MGRSILYAVLLVAILVASTAAAAASGSKGPTFYARVDYLLTAEDSAEITLTEGAVREIAAPPEPSGYKLYYIEVFFEGGLPKNVVPVGYDYLIEERGTVIGLVSTSGTVSIACRSENATLTVKVKAVYLKREWVKISGQSIKIKVEDPGTPFSKDNLSVKVTIENHAPYAIVGVKGPGGVDLTDARKQEAMSPDTIQVDPKHVVIQLSELPLGEYEILLAEGEEYVLPSAFIAAHEAFYNDTVQPGRTKVFRVRPPKGWKYMACVVVLYSLSPVSSSKASAYVEAEAVDLVYVRDESVSIKAASFLVPPLNLRLWVRAYIAFGDSFRVVNPMGSPVSVIYVPVIIKGAGDWTPEGVYVTVSEEEIKKFAMAYVVVQVPSYGKIVDIVTPSGDSYGEYRSALKPWFSALRGIGMLDDEAYIQVKAGSAIEAGEYFFKIEWEPITLAVVDSKGRPIAGATVELSGPLNTTVVTGADGTVTLKLYKPGVYNVGVRFRGVPVAEYTLGTIISKRIEIPCAVYDLTVVTVSLTGAPLPGTEVTLITPDGKALLSAETNDKGVAVLTQIPKGKYVVHAIYKRIEKMQDIEVSGDRVLEVKLDVLFEIPLLGIPISSFEAAAAGLSLGATAVLFKLVGRRGGEEEIEELEVAVGD